MLGSSLFVSNLCIVSLNFEVQKEPNACISTPSKAGTSKFQTCPNSETFQSPEFDNLKAPPFPSPDHTARPCAAASSAWMSACSRARPSARPAASSRAPITRPCWSAARSGWWPAPHEQRCTQTCKCWTSSHVCGGRYGSPAWGLASGGPSSCTVA